jgi:hypothetical protein
VDSRIFVIEDDPGLLVFDPKSTRVTAIEEPSEWGSKFC